MFAIVSIVPLDVRVLFCDNIMTVPPHFAIQNSMDQGVRFSIFGKRDVGKSQNC